MCITIQALIRVRYSRNDPICLPTFGIVAGKTRMPVAQYAPGCTPPPRGLINLPGSSLEYPRYSQEYLNHVTFAPPRGGRPDGAGWLPRRVRTDGRVNLSGRGMRAGYEPCTFEQQALFEDHSQHTFDRWRRPARDGQSGLPSTTLDYVSATELSPT